MVSSWLFVEPSFINTSIMREALAGPDGARRKVAAFGEELEAIVALARGEEPARRQARSRALALQREMRGLDGDATPALPRSAPEQIVLQVRVRRARAACACGQDAAQPRAGPRLGCPPGGVAGRAPRTRPAFGHACASV